MSDQTYLAIDNLSVGSGRNAVIPLLDRSPDTLDWWQFPVRHIFETKRFEAARKHVSHRTHGRCEIATDSRKGFHYGLSAAPLKRTGIVLLSTDSECEWDSVNRLPDVSPLSLHVSLSGSYDVEWRQAKTSVVAGNALFLGQGSRVVKHHARGQSEQILVLFDIKSFERVLADEFDVRLDRALQFEPMHALEISSHPFLFDYLRLVIRDFFCKTPMGAHPVLKSQNENLLLSLLLRVVPHNYSRHLDVVGAAVPVHVKRAERFLVDNFDRDLTLEEVVRSAGTSVRTLQYSFRDFRGTTPMRFLKELRLNAARDLIHRMSDGVHSLGNIAAKAGYPDLCKFSRDYKERFGEPPSTTRKRLALLRD